MHTWRLYWKVTGRLEHCDLLTITYCTSVVVSLVSERVLCQWTYCIEFLAQ